MKKILLFFVFAAVGHASGQSAAESVYYLDAQLVDIKNIYINALSLDSIVVERKTANGEVYMKSKRPITFITLDDVLKKYTSINETVNPVIYLIGDKLITSKKDIRIDNSYYIYVKTIDLKDLTYIDKKYKNLVLVRITLSQEELKPEVNANDILDILKQ